MTELTKQKCEACTINAPLVEKKRFKIDEILNDRNNPKDTVPGNNYEYLILSCDLYPMNFTGDKKTDEAKGIMHMHLGRDRGLIKEIEFSKNSTCKNSS